MCRLGLLIEVEKAVAEIEASKQFHLQEKDKPLDLSIKNKKDE